VPRSLSEAQIEAFRERLCDIAEPMFAKRGAEGVTLRELAAALGVSSMTPYRYFEDKDAILAAVRARAFRRFGAAMEAAEEARRSGGLAQAENAYIDFALQNPAAYRLMFDTHQPTAQRYPELLAAMHRARNTMSSWLRDLAEQGRFHGDVELWAHAVWATLHGAVMLELAGGLRPPLDARTVARAAIRAQLKEMGLIRSTGVSDRTGGDPEPS